jgi:hypothetical protein
MNAGREQSRGGPGGHVWSSRGAGKARGDPLWRGGGRAWALTQHVVLRCVCFFSRQEGRPLRKAHHPFHGTRRYNPHAEVWLDSNLFVTLPYVIACPSLVSGHRNTLSPLQRVDRWTYFKRLTTPIEGHVLPRNAIPGSSHVRFLLRKGTRLSSLMACCLLYIGYEHMAASKPPLHRSQPCIVC